MMTRGNATNETLTQLLITARALRDAQPIPIELRNSTMEHESERWEDARQVLIAQVAAATGWDWETDADLARVSEKGTELDCVGWYVDQLCRLLGCALHPDALTATPAPAPAPPPALTLHAPTLRKAYQSARGSTSLAQATRRIGLTLAAVESAGPRLSEPAQELLVQLLTACDEARPREARAMRVAARAYRDLGPFAASADGEAFLRGLIAELAGSEDDE